MRNIITIWNLKMMALQHIQDLFGMKNQAITMILPLDSTMMEILVSLQATVAVLLNYIYFW
jgi:hypothetical protein